MFVFLWMPTIGQMTNGRQSLAVGSEAALQFKHAKRLRADRLWTEAGCITEDDADAFGGCSKGRRSNGPHANQSPSCPIKAQVERLGPAGHRDSNTNDRRQMSY